MQAAPASFYVYYRVLPRHASELRSAVDAVMNDLRQRTGVAGRLARQRDDANLWMEIYEGIADAAAFERELVAAVARHEVARWLPERIERRVEIFVPLNEN